MSNKTIMVNTKISYFILGGVVLGPIFSFLILNLRSSGEMPDQNYVAIKNAAKDVRCPDGAVFRYEDWGESGLLGKCQLTHGDFYAAEHGKLVVKRRYSMGQLVSEEE